MTSDRSSSAKALVSLPRMGGPGLRAFFRIAAEWGLSAEQQMTLLGAPSSTYYHWKKKVFPKGDINLSRDTLERLSYVLGIYKALQILLPESHAGWIKRPNTNPLFGGRPALDRMLSGQVADLYIVRQFLDGWRGGWA
ncbi:MAG: hypothetical protein H6Q00_2183 [Holophagaceae bacterium]|nr:hypothetical protein [Holophagaceae bacterium]